LSVYDAGVGDGQDAVLLLQVGGTSPFEITTLIPCGQEVGLQSAVMELARAFHGAAVVMEHRYYGMSIPFVQKVLHALRMARRAVEPMNRQTNSDGTLNATLADLKPEQWKYLSFDQAVADMNAFPLSFAISNNASAFGNVAGVQGLRPSSTPYVMLGAGIGGTRSAAARTVAGSNVFASWSSSAVVQAQSTYPQYFAEIEQACAMMLRRVCGLLISSQCRGSLTRTAAPTSLLFDCSSTPFWMAQLSTRPSPRIS
jgi:hypothetical protein